MIQSINNSLNIDSQNGQQHNVNILHLLLFTTMFQQQSIVLVHSSFNRRWWKEWRSCTPCSAHSRGGKMPQNWNKIICKQLEGFKADRLSCLFLKKNNKGLNLKLKKGSLVRLMDVSQRVKPLKIPQQQFFLDISRTQLFHIRFQ